MKFRKRDAYFELHAEIEVVTGTAFGAFSITPTLAHDYAWEYSSRIVVGWEWCEESDSYDEIFVFSSRKVAV